jgi:hypothetical protein
VCRESKATNRTEIETILQQKRVDWKENESAAQLYGRVEKDAVLETYYHPTGLIQCTY